MGNLVLDAQERAFEHKARDLRQESKLPAVVYGHGFEPINLVLDYQAVRKAYLQAGETSLVDIKVGGKKVPVLFKELQFHPVTGKIQHVDFYKVNLKEEVTAMTPVVLQGVAPAVKELAGVLTQSVQEVEVKALPQNIPHELVLDISSLVDFSHALHVSDLVVPEGVEVMTEPEITIVTVSAPREEEPEVVAAEAAEGAESEDAADEEAGE